MIDHSVRIQALAVVITLVMMAGAGLAVAGTIIRPLDHLTEATEQVASGDFDLGRAAAAAGRDRSPAGFLPAHGGGPRGLARACAASGAARRADRPAQPRAASRAAEPGAGAARGRYGEVVAVLCARPRPVQGRQRHAGPRRRRPAAQARWRQRLQACVRETDTVARLGGDEFAIVQVGCRRSRPTRSALRRAPAGDVCAQPVRDRAATRSLVSASIGIALVADATATMPTSCSERRHRALPRQGRRPRHASASSSRGWTRACRRARRSSATCARRSAASELELHYQPQVDLGPSERSPASRRCCAGTIPSTAWSRPASSSRWPRRPG